MDVRLEERMEVQTDGRTDGHIPLSYTYVLGILDKMSISGVGSGGVWVSVQLIRSVPLHSTLITPTFLLIKSYCMVQ